MNLYLFVHGIWNLNIPIKPHDGLESPFPCCLRFKNVGSILTVISDMDRYGFERGDRKIDRCNICNGDTTRFSIRYSPRIVSCEYPVYSAFMSLCTCYYIYIYNYVHNMFYQFSCVKLNTSSFHSQRYT